MSQDRKDLVKFPYGAKVKVGSRYCSCGKACAHTATIVDLKRVEKLEPSSHNPGQYREDRFNWIEFDQPCCYFRKALGLISEYIQLMPKLSQENPVSAHNLCSCPGSPPTIVTGFTSQWTVCTVCKKERR
jgi:hypothetical protein